MRLSKCQVGGGRCNALVPPGMVVCGSHADQLALELLGASSLLNALEDAHIKGQRFSTGSTSAGVLDEAPVPFNRLASEARTELLTALTSAADRIAEERKMFQAFNSDRALGPWLARQVPWLRAHPEGAERVEYLLDVLYRAARVVDRPPDRVYLGRCVGRVVPGGDPVEPCTEELYAVPTRPEFSCPRCGWIYQLAERRAHLLGMTTGLQLGATDCARALAGLGLDITASRVRVWASRHLIKPVEDGDGNPVRRRGHAVYLVADVLAVVERMARDRGRDTSVVDSLRRMVSPDGRTA
ncbi:hypothetical protein APR04_003789 [Promicromonospora umidemergens]|uniref:Uncharacterized protein n=1 Tax=Promicromonospora umidemergens TaxID=629679 RepID=A0ABP8XJH9_9MICO|nr:hypothetical protein [Promicromonospora umidemergens]MCP2284866.1 hypothetical protein [Promicromonospora umidemergens]